MNQYKSRIEGSVFICLYVYVCMCVCESENVYYTENIVGYLMYYGIFDVL